MNKNLIIAILYLIAAPFSLAWSAPITAYVSEFDISGAVKPNEMKATIQAMLLSRLSSEKIATQAKSEGAVIKISGSYIQSGNVFSLDAAASNGDKVITRAFTQGKSSDELIPAVSSLAKTLSDGIDKSFASLETLIPAGMIKPMRTVSATGQVIHSIVGALSGLAVGRTFPDGERELFVVGPQVMRYYRQGAELKLLAEIPYKTYEKILAVDTDIPENGGNAEVYITVMNGENLISQVWTADGASMKQVAGPLPYYFRSVKNADGKKKIYAQQISGLADFSGEVSELVKSGEGYVLKNSIKLPKQGYLYNFGLIADHKGVISPIIADRSGYLKVYNQKGDELWKSSDEYSGSETGFKRSDRDSLSSVNGYRQVYLDQRIVVKKDGELLVPKNSASWYMLSKHTYSNNSLYCFVWDGSDLQEKWHTKQSDFYLADFAYDDNSKELLTLEVVTKEEGVFDKGASRLVIRKID